jgi:hypothetical protein
MPPGDRLLMDAIQQEILGQIAKFMLRFETQPEIIVLRVGETSIITESSQVRRTNYRGGMHYR